MNTKYKKVSVSERLPEKDGNYICIVANGASIMTCHSLLFGNFKGITHWLEEVPDMEEEMIELIERFVAITALGEKSPDYLVHDGENLLIKLKQ